jgi:hypothetical protein
MKSPGIDLFRQERKPTQKKAQKSQHEKRILSPSGKIIISTIQRNEVLATNEINTSRTNEVL